MALLILATGIDLLISPKQTKPKLNIIDVLLLAFYIFILIRAATTPYMPILQNTHFIYYTLLTVFYFIIKQLLSKEFKFQIPSLWINFKNIVLFIIILTGLGQAIWGLLQLANKLSSFNPDFKITGTFFNPAPYALFLAIIFPLALGTFFYSNVSDKDAGKFCVTRCSSLIQLFYKREPRKILVDATSGITLWNIILKYTAFLTVVAILLVLPGTLIRASWVATMAGSIVVLNYKYKLIEKLKQLLFNKIRIVVAILMAIVVVTSLGVGLYYLKKSSSIGKLLIFKVTLSKIIERPIFGHGVGRFTAEYNNWQAAYFREHLIEMDGIKGRSADNTYYAFNEYLEITAELGLLGLSLFLTVISMVFLNVQNNNKITNPLFGSLISLLVCAAFSFPFYSLPTQILLFILLALLSSLSSHTRVCSFFFTNILSRHSMLPFRIAVVSVICAIYLSFYSFRQFEGYYKWDEADKLYGTKSYTESCCSFFEVYNQMKYDGEFLQSYGKACYMKRDYISGLEILTKAKYLASDDFLYTTLGDLNKAIGSFKEAEQAYYNAFYMVPNKFYPLYLLAKLYDENGQVEKANQIAHIIIKKKPKVSSAAVDQMQMEMYKMISK
jgi:O-antigen polymerase